MSAAPSLSAFRADRRAVRQGAVHEGGEQGVDLAEAAERRRGQMAGQRPVAFRKRRETGRFRERFVERATVSEDRIEQRMRDLARSLSSAGFRAAHRRSAFLGWQPGARRA